MFILGLPLGAAAFFYANRILPADFATRSAWEVHSFFIALGAMGVWAFFGRSRRDWQIALVLIGTLYCALPILNALTSPSHFIDNIQSQQWALVGFDVLAVLIGVVMLFASTKLSVVAKTLQKPNRKNTISDKKPMRKPVETTYATELTSSPLEEAKS